MGIFEILLILVIAVIVIPPDDLPYVMRTVGKVLRELRLASNTVMRELSGAVGGDPPHNLLPPRLDSRLSSRTILAQSAPAPNAAPTADSSSAAPPATAAQTGPDVTADSGSHPAPAPQSDSALAGPATSSAPAESAAPAADAKP